ncbi:MAG: YkgJ family cysteine cluster protein [Sulfurisoma sp.]|nr:YkgJ family cysteine cluster protein [Sulfurisoma sp.]
MANVSKQLAAFCRHDPALLAIAEKVSARLAATWNSRANRDSPAARYADLLAAADTAIEEQKARATVALPCRAGCNHCCQFQRITLTTTEAVLLVRHLEERTPVEQKTAVIAALLSSSPTGVENPPCAFLTEQGCAVYASRPITCRGYYSLSESACRAFLADKRTPPQNLMATRIVELAVLETAKAFRHSQFFEINGLMRRIYSDPAKPAQWAAESPTDESDLAIDTKEMLGG